MKRANLSAKAHLFYTLATRLTKRADNKSVDPGYTPAVVEPLSSQIMPPYALPEPGGDAAASKPKAILPIDPKVQQALVNAGYYLGTTGPEGKGVDGKLGVLTRAALNKLKASKGLQKLTDQQLFDYILQNMNTGVSNRQYPEEPKQPGMPVAPMGPGLGGIGNTKSTAKDSA